MKLFVEKELVSEGEAGKGGGRDEKKWRALTQRMHNSFGSQSQVDVTTRHTIAS